MSSTSDTDPSEPIVSFMKIVDSLSAIAQNGLTYGKDKYDLERYEQLRDLVARMLGDFTAIPAAQVGEWLAKDSGYATPKLDVRAIVLRADTVLLTKESIDGLWALPGGWADVNTSPAESIEREVREETGLHVRATRLVALHDKRKRDYPFQIPHAYKAFFLCEEIGGEIIQGTLETLEARFFELDSIPPLSDNRITEAQLRHLVALAAKEDQPTEFD
jgi:ADP-ribose pyrophosphatase YjhB (NUDIX family)